MTFNSNRMLDEKYEIVREIKKGGFGIVYYGMDRKLNKPVAIKEIAPNLVDDPKYLDMFQEEALNIAKLSHNNIVHIYELKKHSDRHLYIIMEFIDGIDLEKIIRHCKKHNKTFPPHLAVYIVSEICMALEYAHQRRDAFTNKPLNLVHQDISPSNIMISRFGAIKLIDFGIATVRRHHKEKRDSKLRGKIPYMAPEQLIMGNHPDHRSDLFSLGLVLLEIITGERLFTTQEEVIAAGKNPKWFRKALKGKKIPTPLVKILLHALEIDLSKRYQNANHMYIDLLQYLISCNETGELMDDLAAFLSDQFSPQTPLITPPTYGPTPGPNGYQNIPPAPRSYQQDYSTTVNWPLTEPTPALTPIPAPPQRPQPKPAPHVQPQRPSPGNRFQSNFNTMEFEVEGEEELKTVIDVLRISARNHKKRILQAGVGVLVALLVFAGVDTMNRWTPVGTWLYDIFFPPAIEIASVPPKAAVSIDGERLLGATPLPINEISPGVHKLELTLAGYKPIVKSLFVPRDGDIRVQGEDGYEDSRNYMFRFTTEIEFKSQPAGARVYVNGIRLNQLTPCKIAWEIGNPLAVEYERDGFEKLAGYKLDTAAGRDEVDDRRLWDLAVYNENYTTYAVTGIFRKQIMIESVPTGVEIVDVKTGQIVGIGGNSSGVMLPIGTYELEFRKDRFISKTIDLDVNEDFNEKVEVVLSRSVTFAARDSNNPERGDISATVVSIRGGNTELLADGKQTPMELVLPAYSLRATFSKPGYERKSVRIATDAQSVVVALEPELATFEILVRDALTEEPVLGAEVTFVPAEGSAARKTLIQRTDIAGKGVANIPAGNYIFTVRKPGYNDIDRTTVVRAGDNTNMIFEVFPSN